MHLFLASAFAGERASCDSPANSTARRIFFSCCALWLAACASPDGPPLEFPTPDTKTFALHVYPVLIRDCGFPACHGARERFFRVFGPGRTRMAADTLPYDPATQAEIQSTYDRAL